MEFPDPVVMGAQFEARIDGFLRDAMSQALAGFEADDIVALPEGFKPDLEAILADVWLYASRAGGDGVLDGLKGAFPHLESKDAAATLWEQIRDAFVEQYGTQKVTRIFETTRTQLLRMIQAGIQDGKGIEAMVSDIREAIPELSRTRAHIIARTETHGASRHASQAVARTARFPLNKTWLIVRDARTRDFGEADGEDDEFNHRQMDGVTIPLSQPYFVPTVYGTREPLMFPGDPNGSAGNIINCRCGERYSRAD